MRGGVRVYLMSRASSAGLGASPRAIPRTSWSCRRIHSTVGVSGSVDANPPLESYLLLVEDCILYRAISIGFPWRWANAVGEGGAGMLEPLRTSAVENGSRVSVRTHVALE